LKVYWRSADGTRAEITLGEIIGSGKQGDVYLLAEEPTLCAKAYREPRSDVRRHIEVLTSIDSAGWYQKDERHLEVAWPVNICEDSGGIAIGFFMNTLPDRYFSARDAFSTVRRARNPSLNWGCHVALAADLARMVGKLHGNGMLVGDLALPNLAVSGTGRVLFLDSDSFVVNSDSETYGGHTWRPDNNPPEGGPGKHTRQTDYFALAVAICELLLEEFSPFAGVDTSVSSDEERSPAANIARGRSWLFHTDIRMPRGCPPPELLPSYLRDLAHAAFEEGATNPPARPTAHAWYQGLVTLGQSLRHCGRSPQHVFDADGWTWCPWCERTEQQGGRDPFPSSHHAPTKPSWLATPLMIDEGWPDDEPTVREFLNALQPGQLLRGKITRLRPFGAFVDLGVMDGLIHTSELSWTWISHPNKVVKAGQDVTVQVLHVDPDRERVSLSLKAAQEDPWHRFARTHQVGQTVPGCVTRLVAFGAFVNLGDADGLVHISELAIHRVEAPGEIVEEGKEIFVKIIGIDPLRRRISLSLKQLDEAALRVASGAPLETL
jgi:predicted RNA-binding protein with RPS1 domain